MGRVIPFSGFDRYFEEIQSRKEFCLGTILDANILISLSYDAKSNHDSMVKFFSKLDQFNIPCFTTVTTRSEVLDFHRRLMLTEHLLDATKDGSPFKLTTRSRGEIKTKEGLLTSRKKRKPGTDFVFTDTDLKDIKKAFSAGQFSGNHGWLAICESIMTGRLEILENDLLDRGVTYISQHQDSQKELFFRSIDWPDARSISEQTGLGISDAMVLNAFQCSRFPFMVSADFDVGYAALASSELKDVVMPDSAAKVYRDYHF